jgi:hypothetical protein
MSSLKNIQNEAPQGVERDSLLGGECGDKIWDKIEEPIKILGYAHDWMLHTSRRTPIMTENELQRSTNKIAKWANVHYIG